MLAAARAPAKRHPPPPRPARLPSRRRRRPQRPQRLPPAVSTIARPIRHAKRRRCGRASALCGSELLQCQHSATDEIRRMSKARAQMIVFISIFHGFLGVSGIPLQHHGGCSSDLDRDHQQQSCFWFTFTVSSRPAFCVSSLRAKRARSQKCVQQERPRREYTEATAIFHFTGSHVLSLWWFHNAFQFFVREAHVTVPLRTGRGSEPSSPNLNGHAGSTSSPKRQLPLPHCCRCRALR